jgi:hypothetical protein
MRCPITRRSLLGLAALDATFSFPLFQRKQSIAGINFQMIRRGSDRRRYIWIHGNELTARDILQEHMKANDGCGFFIESKDRNVTLNGGMLDPNRMFSREGAERNLRMLNPEWPDRRITGALNHLDEDRDEFLRAILPRPGNLLVALHNNGPNYSVKNEIETSNRVALNDSVHPDEFMLCSSATDFAVLANSRFNALLQDKPSGPDDGSLSRLCARRGIRYVNVEAAHGNLQGQKRMLDWLELALA